MITKLSTFIFLWLTYIGVAQNVIQEKVLMPAKGKLGCFDDLGFASVYSELGTDGASAHTPKFEIAEIEGNGFIVRDQWDFYKYNEALELEWKSTLLPKFTFKDVARGKCFGKGSQIYFYEMALGKANAVNSYLRIVKFDSQGKYTEKTILARANKKGEKAPKIEFEVYSDFFITESGARCVTISKSEGQVNYYMADFDPINLDLRFTKLPFSDKDLLKGLDIEIPGWFGNTLPQEINSTPLVFTTFDFSQEMILSGELSSRMVSDQTFHFELLDSAGLNKIRSLDLRIKLDDKLFFEEPYWYWDLKGGYVYGVGLLGSKVKRSLDRVYIYKFSISSGELLNHLIINADELLETYASKYGDGVAAPTLSFEPSYYLAANFDKEKRLKVWLKSKRFDKAKENFFLAHTLTIETGNLSLLGINELVYSNDPTLYYNTQPVFKGLNVYIANKQELDAPEAYIQNKLLENLSPTDKKLWFWKFIYRQDYMIAVYVRETNSEVKAFKIAYK